jgi:rod shape-determining protein MreC
LNRFWRRKGFWTILITALVLLIVMRLSSSNRQEITGLEKFIRQSYAPLQVGLDRLVQGIGHARIKLVGGADLAARIANLENENSLLNQEIMLLRDNQAEVDRLSGLLSYQQSHKDQYDLVTARVVARSPNNWYRTLIIDKGTESGLAVNMPVINPYGLVGKVVTVSSNSSQIWLITDREMAVGAILQKTRDTRGIVEGMGDNSQLRMINIPYYSLVSEGEWVVSSGLSDIYPPGIQIGSIREIKKDANGLVLSATVEPAVNFDQLEEVLVIKNYRGQQEIASRGV